MPTRSYRRLFTGAAFVAHLLMVVLTAVAISLGMWQLNSWREERSDEVTQRVAADPVPLNDALGPDEPFQKPSVGQPVQVVGQWVPDSTVFIADRRGAKQPDGTKPRGFWAATALTNGGATDSAIYVVRGWVADPTDAPAPPAGSAEVFGWLQPAEGGGAGDDNPEDDVIPQVRIADLIQHLDQDLYGGFVVADASRPGQNPGTQGLSAVTPDQVPPVSRSTGLRNLLYAIEWWVFGGFVIFMWWRWCADQVNGRRAPGAAKSVSDEGGTDVEAEDETTVG